MDFLVLGMDIKTSLDNPSLILSQLSLIYEDFVL